MTTLNLVAGEYLRSELGTHVLDEHGFATKAEAATAIEVDSGVYASVWAQIQEDRSIRGVDPDTGLPIS